jgi:hypothetical protein
MEKSDGCNHVTYRGCSTSLCWICLGVFDHDKIYDHMNAKHGNTGLEDENGDGMKMWLFGQLKDGEYNETGSLELVKGIRALQV